MFMNIRDFEKIEKLIQENKDRYVANAFYLDRFDSECKRCFIIRSNILKNAIVFDSVEQFAKWING